MRLLPWFFLAILVTLLSLCEAGSSNSNQSLRRVLATTFSSRDVTDNIAANNDENVLKNDNMVVDDEERVLFGAKFKNMFKDLKLSKFNYLKRFKAWYLKWEQGKLTPQFEKLAREGKSYDEVMKGFQTGTMGVPSGYKRFGRLYNAYLKTHNPDLARATI